jgi:catechol-2,3-dioxygenase
MPRPKKLSHIVFRTNRLDEMVQWYLTATDSHVVYRGPRSCFITYDEEHHRIGFVLKPELTEQTKDHVGVEHIGFTFETLDDLLAAYVELRDRQVVPRYCTNHGPTTSFYYSDPDGNHVELLLDNYTDPKDADRFVASDAYRANPSGLRFDPELLLRRAKEGVPISRLTAYEPLT